MARETRAVEIGRRYGELAADADAQDRPRTRENLTERATNTVWMDIDQMIRDEYPELDSTEQSALVAVALDAARDAWASREGMYEDSSDERVPEVEDRAEKLAALAAAVGDDGTGDLGVVIDTSPDASVDELIDIVREAREDARIERERA